jgi:hypothetical protein
VVKDEKKEVLTPNSVRFNTLWQNDPRKSHTYVDSCDIPVGGHAMNCMVKFSIALKQSGIAQFATEGQTVWLPPVLMQPIAADDVAAVVADVALAEPLNGTFELAGPELIRLDDLVRQFLNATSDTRTVITDPKALYYGIAVNDQSLTPGNRPRLGPTRFEDWLSSRSMAVAR